MKQFLSMHNNLIPQDFIFGIPRGLALSPQLCHIYIYWLFGTIIQKHAPKKYLRRHSPTKLYKNNKKNKGNDRGNIDFSCGKDCATMKWNIIVNLEFEAFKKNDTSNFSLFRGNRPPWYSTIKNEFYICTWYFRWKYYFVLKFDRR